jgi:uncharacterized damage-inducible protein DinB
MNITEHLLREFDFEFPTTRKFLALVPDDKLTWKPHTKSMELGRLAWHLSDFPTWATDGITKDELILNSKDFPEMGKAWNGKTREAILARFDTDVKAARENLAAAPEEIWSKPWKMGVDDQIWINEPRIDVYRKWVISHQAHHRAQFGVYLRLLDIPIPGIYGPSADES